MTLGDRRIRDEDAGLSQDVAPDSMTFADPEGEVTPRDPKAERRRAILRGAGAAFSILIVGLAVFVLMRTLAQVNYTELRAAIANTSAEQIALSVLFATISYLALTGYDALALKQLGEKVAYRTTALASFTSYAISFTLGFPLITGGTVRYWIYSRAGLRASKVASLTVIAGVTFWLGMGLVVGAGLVWRAEALADINQLKVLVNVLIGAGILGAIGAYLVWVAAGHRRVRIQGFKLELPGAGLTAAQMVLGVIDLCAAAAALYVLLPGHGHMDFFTFAATYVFACMLGIASHAPGGIGVFEVTMLKSLWSPSQEALLASLLLFRVIYYFIPFLLALAMLGANEGLRRWKSLRAAMSGQDS